MDIDNSDSVLFTQIVFCIVRIVGGVSRSVHCFERFERDIRAIHAQSVTQQQRVSSVLLISLSQLVWLISNKRNKRVKIIMALEVNLNKFLGQGTFGQVYKVSI